MKKILVVLALAGVGWFAWRAFRRMEDPRLVAAGTLEARTVEVGSLVGGRVRAVLVREGDRVAAGERMIELEDALLRPQLETQRARVEEVRARATLAEAGPRSEARSRARIEWEAAKTDLARIEALFRDAVVGRQEYDRALVREATARETWQEADRGTRSEEVAAARAALAREQAQLAYLDAQIAELTVVAPVAGRIEVLDLRPGDLVAPNQAVATLLEEGEIWVRVYVPETRLGEVAPGGRAEIAVDTFPGRAFPARVEEVRHQAEYLPRNVQTLDQRTDQLFGVRVVPDPTAEELRPGMAATVRFLVARVTGTP